MHNIRNRLLFGLGLSVLATAVFAEEAESTALDRFCVSGLSLVSDAIRYGDFAFPVREHEETSTTDGSYWYGEWFGRLIPVPVIEGEWDIRHMERSSFLKDSFDSMSFSMQLSEIDLRKYGVKLSEVSVQFGLPPTSLSDFDALLLAVSTDMENLECDNDDVQSTVNLIDALVLRSQALSAADDVFVVGDDVVVTRQRFTRDDVWRYYFSSAPGSGTTLKIELRANRELLPDFGLNIAKAIRTYSYSNAEPDWLPEFFARSETNVKKTMQAAPQRTAGQK